MSTLEIIEAINTVSFFVYVVLIIPIAARQTFRLFMFWYKKEPPPALLVRDNVFYWALVVLLMVPLLLGLATDVRLSELIPWVIIRAVIGLLALGVWFYYEFFVISKRKKQ